MTSPDDFMLMKNPPQSPVSQSGFTCIEICSGAGGQAIGLERAGFEALAHVEFDRHACETLRLNRPDWNVVEGDVRDFSGKEFKGVDLLAGEIVFGINPFHSLTYAR